MKQSTCGAVICQPGGDELKHDTIELHNLVVLIQMITTKHTCSAQLLLYLLC